jgi:hypothetical protein
MYRPVHVRDVTRPMRNEARPQQLFAIAAFRFSEYESLDVAAEGQRTRLPNSTTLTIPRPAPAVPAPDSPPRNTDC